MITFEELCIFALARLPERLRRLRVPSADVGDIVHDVLLVALPKLGQFECRPLGSGEKVDVYRALLAWLVGIAWRRVTRHRTSCRSRLERCQSNVAELEAAGCVPLTPEEMVSRCQQRDLALDVLAKLRPEQALVLVLHDVGELPVPEIGRRLEVNANTVRSRLLRARRDAQAAVQRMRWSDGDAECQRLRAPRGTPSPPTLSISKRSRRRGSSSSTATTRAAYR
jgi:RNA polymerase sigma factor (sigma-70 family)